MNGLIPRILCKCGHHREKHYSVGCLTGWAVVRQGCSCKRYRRRLKWRRGL